ncbi:MAG: alkaline phosphatase family protein [Promethearchaeota archaeon]
MAKIDREDFRHKFLKEAKSLIKPLKIDNSFYAPSYKRNISMVLPAALELLGFEFEGRKSLLEDRDCGKTFKTENPENIILLIVDSLGIDQFLKSSIFQHIGGCGRAFPISSVFPTVTSSAIVSIHTGLTPERHGILGYKIFFKELGVIVDTLRMCTIKARWRDALVRTGIDMRSLMWGQAPYKDLENQDIKHVMFLQEGIAGTGLSHFIADWGDMLDFGNLIDAFSLANRVIEKYDGQRLLLNIYVGSLDMLSHKYGPNSLEYKLGMEFLEKNLLRFLSSLDPKLSKKTLLLILSDHGQDEIRPEYNLIFSEEDIEDVKPFMRTQPGKSGRIIHFYPREEHQDELRSWLEEKAGDKGIILGFEDIENEILLDIADRDRVCTRVGNMVLALREGIYTRFDFKKENKRKEIIDRPMLGSHGSLSFNEMASLLLTTNLSDFQKSWRE